METMQYSHRGVMSLRLTPELGAYVLSFMIVFVDLNNYIAAYNLVRYAMLVLLGVFVCMKMRIILSVRNQTMYLLWIAFSFIVMVSSFLNRNTYDERNPFLAGIVFFGGLIEMLAIVHYAMVKGHLGLLMNVFYWLGLGLLIINDAMLFAMDPSGNYLVGGKFSMTYFHMLVIALWLFRVFRLRKGRYVGTIVTGVLLFALSLASGIRADCMTGVVGLALMMLWMVVGANAPRFVRNPITAVVAVLLSHVFMYVATAVLNTPFISRIIEQVFQHDSTLSMRTMIYEVVPEAFAEHPFIGHGYGISYLVLTRCNHGVFIPDTQNGLAEWLIFGGLSAGIVLVIMIAYVFWRVATTKNWAPSLNVLVSIVYAFICTATVEITFSEEFFAILMLIYVFAISKTACSFTPIPKEGKAIR